MILFEITSHEQIASYIVSGRITRADHVIPYHMFRRRVQTLYLQVKSAVIQELKQSWTQATSLRQKVKGLQ